MIYKWEINYNRQPLDLNTFQQFTAAFDELEDLTDITIRNGHGILEPYVSRSALIINGDLHKFEHHESLSIKRILNIKPPEVDIITGYRQCDTGDKPYDVVVAATLLLFKHHFPTQVKLYPEEINDNWKRGYDLAQQVCLMEALEELLNA